VAIAVGPITGGLLLDHFWWGSVFLINVPLTRHPALDVRLFRDRRLSSAAPSIVLVPPATEGVMSVLPRERGGAGSAITNTCRQVAVALGVAVPGSVLAQAYRQRVTPYLLVLPARARAGATVSIAQTQQLALQAGPAGNRLLSAASRAFVDATHITSLLSIGIAAAGAVTMAIWMPGRRAGGPAVMAAGRDDHAARLSEPVGSIVGGEG
jgi:MFS family permease